MFFGEYRHQIDDKCRIRIPSKLKDELGANPFIMRGTNKCLFVLREEDAKAILEQQFNGAQMNDPSKNLPLRLLTSSAFFASEDKQGRIILPAKLLEHAGLKEKGSDEINKNVVTIGAFNRVEIWCEDIWDEYSDVSGEEFDKAVGQAFGSGDND